MSSTQEVGNIFVGPAHAMLRSPTVLIASVGLWGMNVYFYRLFGIDYIKVLKYDLVKLEQQEMQQYDYATTLRHKTSNGSMEMTNHPNGTAGANADNDAMMMQQAVVDYYDNDNNSDMMLMDDDSISSLVSVEKQQQQQTLGDSISAAITLLPKKASLMATNAASSPLSPSSALSISATAGLAAAATAAATAITWERLVGLSLTLLCLLHFSYYWWIDTLGGGLLGAVYFFYAIVLLVVVLPLDCTLWLRRAVQIVLFRSWELINPRCHCLKTSTNHTTTATSTATSASVYIPRPIPFVDVFFADAMCSLSKVFFDWGMLLLMAYYSGFQPPSSGSAGGGGGYKPVPRSLHSILIPSCCAAIPYIIRARQCCIMYNIGRLTNDAHRNSHLWNALKYTTSIFPLVLSAFQKTASRQLEKDLEVYLVFLLVLNSTFALYWDVVMDWGMYQSNPIKAAFCGGGGGTPVPSKQSYYTHQYQYHANKISCSHIIMRPRLRFGTAMSALILLTDVILRFSWMLRFANKRLFPSQDSFVLCTQFLEVFRRAMWNLLRVEWENLKQLQMANTVRSNSNNSSSNGPLLLDKKKSSPVPNNNSNTNSGNSTGSINNGGGGIMMVGIAGSSGGGPPSSPTKLLLGERDRGGEQQQRKNATVVTTTAQEEMTSFLPKVDNMGNSNHAKKPSSSSWLRWQKK